MLAFWDLAAAFPSVAHAWLFMVLRARGVPIGLIDLIDSMYRLVSAFMVCGGRFRFLFWILAGVLQGCPLSGMLFAIVMDPFLVKLDAELCRPQLGTVRACADDVGAALRHLSSLRIAKCTFDAAREVANLCLKPTKCVLVPVGEIVTEHLTEQVLQ